MTVVGIVLAAGAGRRYGGPKVLAAQGQWLASAVNALDGGGCDEVVVALGAAIVAVPWPARALVVDDWSDGVGATLRAALGYVAAPGVDGVLVHLVDLPDVDERVAAAVLGAVERPRTTLARAVFDGRPGHPVYLGADHFDALRRTLAGDRGAGPFLAGRDDVLGVDCGHLADGVDHDTPESRS